MRPFEYVSANSKNQVGELLGASWADAEILAGGTDLVALMKDEVVNPERVVNIKGITDLRGVNFDGRQGCASVALTTLDDTGGVTEMFAKQYPGDCRSRARCRQPADPQHGDHRRKHVPAAALLVFPQWHGPAA